MKKLTLYSFVLAFFCAVTGGQVCGQQRPSNQRDTKPGEEKSTSSECVKMAIKDGREIYIMSNVNTPKCKQAIVNLREAAKIVRGWESKGELVSPGDQIPAEAKWLIKIAGDKNWKSKFDDGLSYSEATDFLKEDLAAQSDDVLKLIVQYIIRDIYGKFGEKPEFDYYLPRIKAQTDTYTSIFLAERNKLNQKPGERKLMIDRAYIYGMGRNALDGDIKYWQPRQEVYRDLIPAIQTWLYSANGSDDLWNTIKRAANTAGVTLTATQINEWSGKFSADKRVYWDMLGTLKVYAMQKK